VVGLLQIGQHQQGGGTHTARQDITLVAVRLQRRQKDVKIIQRRTITNDRKIYKSKFLAKQIEELSSGSHAGTGHSKRGQDCLK
jgi:hypothetical protein